MKVKETIEQMIAILWSTGRGVADAQIVPALAAEHGTDLIDRPVGVGGDEDGLLIVAVTFPLSLLLQFLGYHEAQGL